MLGKRSIAVGSILMICSSSCAIGVGRDYGALYASLYDSKGQPGPAPIVSPLARSEAATCLRGAMSEAERGDSDRVVDISLIVAAAFFGAAGTGATTASGFIADTNNGGQPSDTRHWVAGVGAVSLGVGMALLALRTALNYGSIANARVTASAAQAGLATQIAVADTDANAREALFAQCVTQNTQPNSSFPSETQSPYPTSTANAPPPGVPRGGNCTGPAAGGPNPCAVGLSCTIAGGAPAPAGGAGTCQ